MRPPRGKRILVLAPHPDDELLAFGRMLRDAIRRGASVLVVVLTDGQGSHPNSRRWPPARLARRRRGETRQAMARLGARDVPLRFMGWTDLRLGEEARPLRLRRVAAGFRPDLIVTTDRSDHHPDHKAAHALAQAVRGRTALATAPLWAKLATPELARARGAGGAAKRWAMAAYRSQFPGVIADDPEAFTFAPDVLRLLRDTPERLVPAEPSFAFRRRLRLAASPRSRATG